MSALKRKAFIKAYLGEAQGNATKAAIIAGYSERTAPQIGSRLLKHPECAKALQKAITKVDTSTERVLANISAIANKECARPSDRAILKANELLLRVNGALQEKQHSGGITVNIGFLQPPANQTTNAVVMASAVRVAPPDGGSGGD